MASDTSGYVSDAPSQSEVIQDLIAGNAATAVMTAALTLIIYDTTLVFSDELSLIWRRKWGLGTFLYLLARYGTVLQSILYLLLSVSTSTSITYVTVTPCRMCYSCGRDRKRRPLSGDSICCVWQKYLDHYSPSDTHGDLLGMCYCDNALYLHHNFNRVSHNLQAISKSSWSSASVVSVVVLVTQTISVVVMFCRGWDNYNVSRSWDVVHLGHNQPLLILLIQQGVIRLTVIFTWSLEVLLDPKFAGLDSPLKEVVGTILITRFMLQLRHRQQALAASALDLPTVSTAQFSRRSTTGSGTRSALSRITDHILEEFGEPDMPPIIDIRNFHQEDSQIIQTEKGLSRSQTAMAEEYPWACIEHSEMVNY
ncbi:hypothetical protein M422DRAFT_241169 [Sphaerobolus stellatus SS14]|nr:hypothetical protein M422DRAFT_241169 [Sphaerobolus stellatus SS14]